MTQDWLQDPRLQAAAWSGSAANKVYSYTERLAMAMKAISILEDLVRDLDREVADLTAEPQEAVDSNLTPGGIAPAIEDY